MAVSAPALEGALAAAVGAAHVVRDPAALAAVAVDGLAPRWLLRPGGVDEVARTLALAADEGLAVAPRGGGTAVALGNPPRRLDVVLDLGRLDRVVEYSAEDMVATVQAGVRLDALAAVLAAHRQRWPVDPPGAAARTVGGVLATHASGPLRLRHGTGRDLLLGVRFVQADGTVTWGGSRVVKSVTGYDVPKLLVGSLGTLGVVVEATVRLHPVPATVRSWLLAVDAPARAGALVAAVLDSTIEPERMVVLDAGLAAALGAAPAGAAVLVAIGSVPEAVEQQGQRLLALAAGHGARAALLPEDVWARAGRALDAPVVLRLGGEPARVAHWVAELGRAAAALGVPVAAMGEAASGMVQAALPRVPATWAGTLLDPLRRALEPEGGSLVVERVPLAVKPPDVWGPVPEGPLAIMRRLKREFDPAGVLNPGRFVGGL